MLKEMFKKTRYISLDPASSSRDRAERKNSLQGIAKQEAVKRQGVESVVYEENVDKAPSVPDGAWIKCDVCKEMLFHEDVLKNYNCCPKCDAHYRIGAAERLGQILDEGSFEEWDKELTAGNVLHFPEYEGKLERLREKTGMAEGVLTGKGLVMGNETVVACMDASFLMGSMGQAVGEKITRAVEKATEERLPVIVFTTSGGARMQEGITSLMQMAKTSGALKRHSDAGLLYLVVLTDPTTGGVTASFAMLGDIILAEPGALIGFAGPRVIEQTIGQKLPEGFQHSEFLQKKGFVDAIVSRKDMKGELGKLLKMHCGTKRS